MQEWGIDSSDPPPTDPTGPTEPPDHTEPPAGADAFVRTDPVEPLDPRARRSRAAIVPAAIRRFATDGYAATSLADIADEAGVAKRTILNLFGSKEHLFRAALEDAFDTAARYAGDAVEPVVADDLEATLVRAARRLASIVTAEHIVGLRRLVIGESVRFPDLAEEYWRRAPGRTLDAFAVRFDELAAQGALDVGDARRAAEHFAYLTIGASLDHALFHVSAPPDQAHLDAAVDAGVRAFLRAYRTTANPARPSSDGDDDGRER